MEMIDSQQFRTNGVLARLSEAEYDVIAPHLIHEHANVGDVAFEPGRPIDQVYFPLSAIFSIVAVTGDRRIKVEVATVGREGMVGLPVFLGTGASPQEAFCQIPGDTLRLGVEPFRAALDRGGTLTKVLNRFTQASMVQIAQDVVCNRSHTVQKRMARWLLTTHDRVGRNDFPLTENFLGQMLGVYRPTVADAVRHLQDRNIVRYSRDRINIVDRGKLEGEACECYRIVAAEFDDMAQAWPVQ
jgi:CRP-like cAMP-binding protein